MKITKLETFLVKPRWLFLKMHTDEGLVGLGEPILEGRARHLRSSRSRTRTLSHRQRPPSRGPSLAGHVSPCILSRRTHSHQRPIRC